MIFKKVLLVAALAVAFVPGVTSRHCAIFDYEAETSDISPPAWDADESSSMSAPRQEFFNAPQPIVHRPMMKMMQQPMMPGANFHQPQVGFNVVNRNVQINRQRKLAMFENFAGNEPSFSRHQKPQCDAQLVIPQATLNNPTFLTELEFATWLNLGNEDTNSFHVTKGMGKGIVSFGNVESTNMQLARAKLTGKMGEEKIDKLSDKNFLMAYSGTGSNLFAVIPLKTDDEGVIEVNFFDHEADALKNVGMGIKFQGWTFHELSKFPIRALGIAADTQNSLTRGAGFMFLRKDLFDVDMPSMPIVSGVWMDTKATKALKHNQDIEKAIAEGANAKDVEETMAVFKGMQALNYLEMSDSFSVLPPLYFTVGIAFAHKTFRKELLDNELATINTEEDDVLDVTLYFDGIMGRNIPRWSTGNKGRLSSIVLTVNAKGEWIMKGATGISSEPIKFDAIQPGADKQKVVFVEQVSGFATVVTKISQLKLTNTNMPFSVAKKAAEQFENDQTLASHVVNAAADPRKRRSRSADY